MTSEDLKQFFADRPALPVNPIADEAGIGRRTLHYKLTDDPRPISDEQSEDLLPVLKKYGYGRDCLTALKEKVDNLEITKDEAMENPSVVQGFNMAIEKVQTLINEELQ